jgi:SNARE protein
VVAGEGVMASDVPMTPELEQIDGEIQDIFRALQ